MLEALEAGLGRVGSVQSTSMVSKFLLLSRVSKTKAMDDSDTEDQMQRSDDGLPSENLLPSAPPPPAPLSPTLGRFLRPSTPAMIGTLPDQSEGEGNDTESMAFHPQLSRHEATVNPAPSQQRRVLSQTFFMETEDVEILQTAMDILASSSLLHMHAIAANETVAQTQMRMIKILAGF